SPVGLLRRSHVEYLSFFFFFKGSGTPRDLHRVVRRQLHMFLIVGGGPAQAPDEFEPMLPGSGGKTGLPGSFTPSSNKGGAGGNQIDNSATYVLNGAPPPGAMDFVHGVNVPRARQGVNSIPGMPG
ncbi:hypothetical protein, partial [Mycobacterium intracellulare]|uniref:hypothetical protein n=1 Tax=Mycobacterium intracellulare TaxID=1767 RepID=UPI001B3503F0